MKSQILIIACVSVVIGIVCGIAIVLLLYIGRRKKVVNSLMRSNQVLGLSGVVEVPFDARSKGKVRVSVRGSMVDFVAFTDESKAFNKGDSVFIVEIKGNKVGVVSENSLHNNV